jgi:phycobilisome core-membrane linker protein
VRSAPAPSRSWKPASPTGLGRGFTAPSTAPGTGGLPATAVGGWSKTVSNGVQSSPAREPGAAMAQALRGGQPQGFNRRKSLGQPVQLPRDPNETQVQEAIEATYRQLLGRVPFAAERLGDSESQFRNGQLTVAEFVGVVAGSDLFQQRLNRMAPLRAANAAYLALLGRAAQPLEASRFLAARTSSGQLGAVDQVLNSEEYARRFGQDTVPYLQGMATLDGLPLSSVNRTAALYAGNAGLTPSPRGAI